MTLKFQDGGLLDYFGCDETLYVDKPLKVLVACEYSGRVRDAFTALGHYAMSSDLEPTETPGPHYQGDVRDILGDGWDLLIAHPPCTYLSRAGARWLYPTIGVIDEQRYQKGVDAKNFFMELFNAPIPRVAVENPRPMHVFELPEHTQAIEPYQFGDAYSKRTLLWTRGLPNLRPTDLKTDYKPFLYTNAARILQGQAAKGTAQSKKDRSRTFKGIANAMAAQWGGVVRSGTI